MAFDASHSVSLLAEEEEEKCEMLLGWLLPSWCRLVGVMKNFTGYIVLINDLNL